MEAHAALIRDEEAHTPHPAVPTMREDVRRATMSSGAASNSLAGSGGGSGGAEAGLAGFAIDGNLFDDYNLGLTISSVRGGALSLSLVFAVSLQQRTLAPV